MFVCVETLRRQCSKCFWEVQSIKRRFQSGFLFIRPRQPLQDLVETERISYALNSSTLGRSTTHSCHLISKFLIAILKSLIGVHRSESLSERCSEDIRSSEGQSALSLESRDAEIDQHPRSEGVFGVRIYPKSNPVSVAPMHFSMY